MATWACRLGSGGEFDVSPDSYDVVWWEWKTTLRPRPAGNRRGSFIPFIRLV